MSRLPGALTLEEMQATFQAVWTAIKSPTNAPVQNTNLRGQRITNAGPSVAPADYTTQGQVTAQVAALKAYVDTQLKVTTAAINKTIPGTPTGPPIPVPGAPPGTTPPTGTPATGVLTRGMSLAGVTILNSPAAIATWPVTAAISQITIRPGLGVQILTDHTSPPYSTPPVGAGLWPQDPTAYPDAVNLQYTVWALVEVSGVWYASGFVQMWVGRPGTGATPVGADWLNWAYDGRWGAMTGYVPAIGSTMGFFVSAGNARGETLPTTVMERSEVVTLALPDANGEVYS